MEALMMNIRNWFSLLLEQAGKAFSALTLLLAGAEYFAPGSVLPFLNLYLLGAGSLFLLVAFPGKHIFSVWISRGLTFFAGLVFMLLVLQVLAPLSKSKEMLIAVLAALVIASLWLQTEKIQPEEDAA